MRGDQVLPQVPLVLDDLLADLAGHPLALDVHVDGVLLQVERVGEGLEAVGADARLHAPPAVAGVVRVGGRRGLGIGGGGGVVVVVVVVVVVLAVVVVAFVVLGRLCRWGRGLFGLFGLT